MDTEFENALESNCWSLDSFNNRGWIETTTKYHNKKFVIFSDSTNAIASILNQWTNNTIIHEYQNVYIESIKNNSVAEIWIQSHIRMEMNERADKAIREAPNSTIPYHKSTIEFLPLKIHHSTLLVHLKQKMKHHWNNEWKILVKNDC